MGADFDHLILPAQPLIPASIATQNIFNAGGGPGDDGGTVIGWAFPRSAGGGSAGRLFSKGTNFENWAVHINQSELRFFKDFDGGIGRWRSPTNSFVHGVWSHFCLRYFNSGSGSVPEIDINGVSQAITVVNSPSGFTTSDTGMDLSIGNRPPIAGSTSISWDGVLANMRLYERYLTDEEVMEDYVLNGRHPSRRDLVAFYPLKGRPGLHLGGGPYKDLRTNTTSQATSINLTVPPHVDGDGLVMVVAALGDNVTSPSNITTPAGWTPRAHVDVAPTPPSWPVIAVYVKTASSEPASVNVTSGNAAQPWAGTIINVGKANLTPDVNTSSIGTSSTPTSPSVTPSVPVMMLWACVIDSDTTKPTQETEFCPVGLNADVVISDSNGSSNGGVLGVSMEQWDATATGTRVFRPTASDQWAALSIGFPYGKGQELPILRDDSVHGNHGTTTLRPLVGAEDDLDV